MKTNSRTEHHKICTVTKKKIMNLPVVLLSICATLLLVAILVRRTMWDVALILPCLVCISIVLVFEIRARSRIRCKEGVAGGVENNDVLCRVNEVSSISCFMPHADSKDQFEVHVRKVDDFNSNTVDGFMTRVTTSKGKYQVDAEMCSDQFPCKKDSSAVAQGVPPWEVGLPWPVIRTVVGSILGGG